MMVRGILPPLIELVDIRKSYVLRVFESVYQNDFQIVRFFHAVGVGIRRRTRLGFMRPS